MKKKILLSLFSLMLLALSVAQLSSANNAVTLSQIGEDLSGIWPDQCAFVVIRHNGFPLISIACKGSYRAEDRDKFLHSIFKAGFILREETYKLSPNQGLYLYKTEYPVGSDNLVFIKLYFRDATFLWPKTPFYKGHLAIFVQDIYRVKDLLKWQSLGIPLSYGVLPRKRGSRMVVQNLKKYSQGEFWFSLSLEPNEADSLKGKFLSTGDALRKDKLKKYLDEFFTEMGTVPRVSTRMGSRFTANVFAMRALLTALKERKVTHFLDTVSIRASVGHRTAQIMSFNAYRNSRTLDHISSLKNLRKMWSDAVSILNQKGFAIVLVHASSWRSFEFIKDVSRKSKKIKFVTVSQIPVEIK